MVKRKKINISFNNKVNKYYMFNNFGYVTRWNHTNSNYPLITIAELQKMCQEPTIYELW